MRSVGNAKGLLGGVVRKRRYYRNKKYRPVYFLDSVAIANVTHLPVRSVFWCFLVVLLTLSTESRSLVI